MKGKKTAWRTVAAITVLSLLLAVAGPGFAEPAEEYMMKIVGLDLPTGEFRPEGSFRSAAEAAMQRQAIASTREALLGSLAGYNAEVYAAWDSIPYVAMKVDTEALEQLVISPYVTSVREDRLREPHLASATAHIGADLTWDAGFGGMGQTVVILDTGIDANHPFFGGRVVDQACWSNAGGAGSGTSLCPDGSNAQAGGDSADALTDQCWVTPGDPATDNICWHGSHVAGIAAGQDAGTGYSGVAPEANIIAIQVYTRIADCRPEAGDQPCARWYDSDLNSALDYINTTLRGSWDIASANMSGGGNSRWSPCDAEFPDTRDAINTLLSNEIVTVISSGNDDWTDAVSFPACISSAVTVGNVYDTDPNSFPNMPDDVTDNMHWLVDLLAAGRDVDSSVPDNAYGMASGTSMAAPEVAGAFAMIEAIDPDMSAADVLDLLQTTGVLVRDERPPNAGVTTDDPPVTQENPVSGYVKPRIQLDAAVAAITEADLRVFKDCKPDDPMLLGEEAICTIEVENLGPDAAMAVVATDDYVSNGEFTIGAPTTTAGTCSVTPNPQTGAGTVVCELGGLEAGDSVTIQIPVSADSTQNINDRVVVSSATPDPDPSNNVAEDEVNVTEMADLEVMKACVPEIVDAGDEATCTITVRNWGPGTAVNTTLQDVHVSDGTFEFGTVTTTAGTCSTTPNPQEGTGTVTCDLGDLAAGAEETVVVPVIATDGMDIVDTATVTSDTYDPDTSNNTATDGIQVNGEADLALTKTATPDPVVAGTTLTYDLEVTNNGPSKAVNVVIEDVMPAGVTINSVSSPDGGCNMGVPGEKGLPTVCTVDGMDSGTTATMQVVVTVNPDTVGILGNNAQVYSDTYDPDNSNNLATTATAVEAGADLAVYKSDFPDPVLAGEMLTYDVTVVNNGPSTAVDTMLSDTLSDWVTFAGYTVSNGAGTCVALAGPPSTVECDLNDLDPGEFVTVYIYVLVDPAVPDGTTITNSATVSSRTADPDPSNNTDTEDTYVMGSADLGITKDASILTDNPAERVVFTIEVTNDGPSVAREVVMVDELPLDPKKIVYIMDSGNGVCTYDEAAHDVTCEYGDMDAGESISVDIVVDVKGSVRRIANIAHVSSSTFDPDVEDNYVVKEVLIKGGPGPSGRGPF
jgi:uncharacterized repeat protein (TIGR01451 family)